MANHPNRARTFWLCYPRDFANEYNIGIALKPEWADYYKANGYERVTKAKALRLLGNRGDAATQVYCAVSINGDQVPDSRFEIAKDLR